MATKKKRSYGRLDKTVIVEGIKKNKRFATIATESGSKAVSDADKASVISRKISKDVNLQEMIKEALLDNREMADSLKQSLTGGKVRAMTGKELAEMIIKLDNSFVSLHKADMLEGGEPTEHV